MLPQNVDQVAQPMGEYQPVDQWQRHVNAIFQAIRGDRAQDYYQTFATADYRLAHALAADYVERVRARDAKVSPDQKGRPLVVQEWGCGHGNLAACFLTHLKALDTAGAVYPRLRYVLVDARAEALALALSHPDLAPHREHVETLQASVTDLSTVEAGSVDRILCNELWNELPTKLFSKKKGDLEEEHVRPNMGEFKHAQIEDWSGFLRAWAKADVARLREDPTFFDELIWEREYHPVDWKEVPYRKTITEYLKPFDDEVLVPVNLGAFACVKEALRVLAPNAVGMSAFDAGSTDFQVLNSADKPCTGHFGGLYSVMVNFALIEAVAKQLGAKQIQIESQREFIGRSLGVNVMPLTDLLASHPGVGRLSRWQQDRLVVQTLHALNEHYRSPYPRTLQFPLSADMPEAERASLQCQLAALAREGVPHTASYLTEEEVMAALPDLETLGYDREGILMAISAPPAGIDYTHWSIKPT